MKKQKKQFKILTYNGLITENECPYLLRDIPLLLCRAQDQDTKQNFWVGINEDLGIRETGGTLLECFENCVDDVDFLVSFFLLQPKPVGDMLESQLRRLRARIDLRHAFDLLYEKSKLIKEVKTEEIE